MKKILNTILRHVGFEIKRYRNNPDQSIKSYIKNGRIPWSIGYVEFKNAFIQSVLADTKLMSHFVGNTTLPDNYGIGLDERCIEYPWFFSNACSNAINWLDAGSALNHEFVINHEFWRNKNLTVLTLSPENNCFQEKKISYQFADLENIPFRDNWFEAIACISTIEHVGMDNSMFIGEDINNTDTNSFKNALLELNRVLKPGGKLYITVPFGKYTNSGIFQQFDADLLSVAANVFGAINENISYYRYTENGWEISNVDDCKDCEYSEYAISLWNKSCPPIQPEMDNAAAARAVACVCWEKRQ